MFYLPAKSCIDSRVNSWLSTDSYMIKFNSYLKWIPRQKKLQKFTIFQCGAGVEMRMDTARLIRHLPNKCNNGFQFKTIQIFFRQVSGFWIIAQPIYHLNFKLFVSLNHASRFFSFQFSFFKIYHGSTDHYSSLRGTEMFYFFTAALVRQRTFRELSINLS